jgi:type IV pilus assembly protein PilO
MDPRIQKLTKLPNKQKVALLILILAALGAGLFFGVHQPKLKQLKELQKKHDGLRKEVSEAKKIADNLPKFRSQYAQLQVDLEKALTELPNQKEIPTLLTTITTAGKSTGLDFLLFKPRAELPKDFYAEVPVDITVFGSFYNVANFFAEVAKLQRIVNITNVTFTDIKSIGGRTTVKVNCLATTFRFLDKKEIPSDKNEKKKK